MSLRDLLKKEPNKSSFRSLLTRDKPVLKAIPTETVEKPPTFFDKVAGERQRQLAAQPIGDTVEVDLAKPETLKTTPEEAPRVKTFKDFLEDRDKVSVFGGIAKVEPELLSKLTRGASTLLTGSSPGTKGLESTRAGQEFATGLASSIPLVGGLFEKGKKAVAEESTLPTGRIPLPGGAGLDVTTSGVGTAAGDIGFTVAQYGLINKALEGAKVGGTVAKLLGSSKKAKFAGTQAADLIADIIVQSPKEFLEAVTNDKTLTEDAKQILLNRALDIGMNLGIGGIGELAKKFKGVDVKPKVDVADSVQADKKTFRQSLEDSRKVAADDARVDDFEFKTQAAKIDQPEEMVFSTTADALESQLKDGNADTFRSKIVRDVPKKQKKSFSDVINKIDTQFIDDTAPFKQLETKIKGKVGSAEESLSKQARLFKGAPEAANEIVRTEIKPAIQLAEKAGFNHKDLGDYALAVHAKDVNEAGLQSGFSTKEINDVIEKFGTPEMEQARKELLKVSDRLLGILKEDGLLSDAQLNALKTKWTNYMPLFRSFDDNKVEFGKGLSDSFSNVTAPIKKLEGSDRDVLDPIESMVKNIYKTVDASRRNRVGLQLAELSKADVDNSFIRKLDVNEKVGRKNVVNVTVDGEKVPFEVEPEIFKAFNNLDKESSNLLIKILSKPASLLRAGATLTPEFALRNPLRDIQNAFVVSKSGFNPITDFASGLASVMKKDEAYTSFLKENAGYGNILSMDRQKHKEVIESVIKQPISKKIVNVMSPKGMLEMLRSISDITESATKVGEFKAALRSGATTQEAAFRARDLMDFARAGSSIRPANRVVAFLNANIQGKSKLVRAIKENPAKVSAKLLTSMTLPSIGAYAMTHKFGNEEQKKIIKDAPDWQKNTFWLMPIPGTDMVARMPKPFDISFAANGTERFLDYMLENDKEAFDGFMEQTVKDQSIPVMLTGIMPILEAMSNYSFFRQGPVIPRREEFIKKEDQFDSRTSEIAKLLAKPARELLGEESNLGSPRAMDYILRTSTGGLGSSVLDGVDWLLDKTGVTDKPVKPKPGLTQLPLLKGFTVNQASSGKSLGEFYDLKTSLQREKGSSALANKPFKQQPLLSFLNKEAKKVSDISKKLREINESKSLTAEQKRLEIDRLTRMRNNIAIEAMKKVKEND